MRAVLSRIAEIKWPYWCHVRVFLNIWDFSLNIYYSCNSKWRMILELYLFRTTHLFSCCISGLNLWDTPGFMRREFYLSPHFASFIVHFTINTWLLFQGRESYSYSSLKIHSKQTFVAVSPPHYPNMSKGGYTFWQRLSGCINNRPNTCSLISISVRCTVQCE